MIVRMPTWLLSSKKCSTANRIAISFIYALSLSLAVGASASIRKPQSTPLMFSLRADIASRSSSSFESILKRWERQYGPEAVEPLLAIAADRHTLDADRYIALMGAARLGGRATSARIVPFLKDPTWMVRSGSLRILTAFDTQEAAEAVLPLLRDPALVVRVEAVAAVEKLRPLGAVDALVSALHQPENYHGGKALWVPQKILAALVKLNAKGAAAQLKPLLDHRGDPELLNNTIDALKALTGKHPVSENEELPVQIKAWKATLSEG